MAKEKELKKSKGKKTVNKKNNKDVKKKQENLFRKFINYINGVKTEFKRVKWPSKKDMFKYSLATIIFVIGFALFFYLIEIILAALHAIGN